MNSDQFKSRLKEAMAGESNRIFADKCALSEGTLRRYLLGETFPPLDTLERIANAAEVSLAWLASGEEAMKREEVQEWPPEGYVSIPRYEIQASAGAGAMVQSEQIVDVMSFKADWLKVSLGMSPANSAVISVCGDSMEPYLNDGDLILIDTAVNKVSNNAIYVIQYDDSLLVKRIQLKGDGTVIVKSDNPHYEPETFRGESANRLRVIGRLVRRLVR